MKDFDELFEGWIAGTLSAAEAAAFLEQAGGPDDPLPLRIDELMLDPGFTGFGNNTQKERLFKQLAEQLGFEKQRPARIISLPKFKWAVAAAVLIFISAGIYLLTTVKEPSNNNIPVAKAADRTPGSKNKAILTINGGQQIILDSQQNGNIVNQSGYQVIKSNGKISYQEEKAQATASVHYNTLTVPRGGQYQLELADGTQVWLNSASSITYPTAFTGSERNVSITGEAYFEVAKNVQKPFKVKVNNMEVQVLGTHFNINAYTDEAAIKTTLLEGSVRVTYRSPVSTITGTQNDPFLVLGPGQQARVNEEQINLVNGVDIEMEMAWKNGLFYFKNADLKTVMRGLARWYDLDVHYAGNVSSDRFEGKVPMDAMLSEVLHILEENKVHFLLEGKKLTVLPYK